MPQTMHFEARVPGGVAELEGFEPGAGLAELGAEAAVARRGRRQRAEIADEGPALMQQGFGEAAHVVADAQLRLARGDGADLPGQRLEPEHQGFVLGGGALGDERHGRPVSGLGRYCAGGFWGRG